MKVVAVIAVIAVLFALIAPVVNLNPVARLVRAIHGLKLFAVLVPLAIPRATFFSGSSQFRGLHISTEESLPVVPLVALDCVLLC